MTPHATAASPATTDATRRQHAVRWLVGTVAVLASLAVFGLYTEPEFMVMLADQMWACF